MRPAAEVEVRPVLGECLAAYPVIGDRLSPYFHPGDRLLPVTCEVLRPRFGDFVLVQSPSGTGSLVLRYIALAPFASRTRRTSFLAWEGGSYLVLPLSALKGRILSVVRDGQTYDLAMARGWPGRDAVASLLHHALAFLRRRIAHP